MNSLHYIFFLLGIAAVALAQDDVDHVEPFENPTQLARTVIHEVNLNRAFDKALPSIRRYITKQGFDPMDIPDIEIPLSHLPGLLKTKMILHNGHIQELSTIFRTGDIILQYSEKKLSFYLNIGWETLDLSHQYSLRYILFSRKGNCYGRYHNVKASMLVDYDFQNRKIDLKFFNFVDVGKFDLKLEGHLIDGLVNLIIKAVTKVFRTNVLLMIEAKAYEEIDKMLQEINDLIPSPYDFDIVRKEVDGDYDFMNVAPYKVDGLSHN